MPDQVEDAFLANVNPQAAPTTPAAGELPTQQAQPQPQQPEPTPEPTKTERAQDALDTDAANKPVTFNVQFGEEERELSSNQIASTFDRYVALNRKHGELKPAIDLVENMLASAQEQGVQTNPQQLAEFLTAAVKAQMHNPPQGANPQVSAQTINEETEAALKAWETENAASLPPGYRENASRMQGIETQLGQVTQLLQQALQGQQQGAQQLQQQAQQVQGQAVNTTRQMIANNLNQVSQHLQLPDEDEPLFMQFAQERGYTLEDFIDPGLTLKVAQDFKNNRQAPEMQRLQEIASRRQAFTGSGGGNAVSGGAAPTPQATPDEAFFASISNR